MKVELSQDQLDTILDCMDCRISEFGESDKTILLARYLRDNYDQDLSSFIWLQSGKLKSEEQVQQEEEEQQQKKVYTPLYNIEGTIIAYKQVKEDDQK